MRVIAGKAKSLPLKTLEGDQTRPTTDRIKETLFNLLQPELPGCRFLDLFAGSGAIGIEALSRGASRAVFVEKNPRAVSIIRENLRFTHLEKEAEVLKMDAAASLAFLYERGESFDLIFLDPPYRAGAEEAVLLSLSRYPVLREEGSVVIEALLDNDLSSLAEANGFQVVREKIYKTNKHVFLQKS